MYSKSQKVLLRWRGRITGPYLLSQIQAMFQAGQIGKQHEWSIDGGTWSPLATIVTPLITREQRRHHSPSRSTSPKANDYESLGPSAAPRIPSFFSGSLRLTPRMLLIVVMAMSPLFLIHFVESMAQAAWFFMAYFAVIWGCLFFFMLMPDKELRNTGLLYALFTCFIGIPVLLIWHRFPVLQALTAGLEQPASHPESRLLAWILGVGLVEEVCKAMPLLIFALSPKIIRSLRDGVWLGALSGLGFALAEGVSYSYQYWSATALLHLQAFGEALEHAQDWLGRVRTDQLEAQLETIVPELMSVSAHFMTIQIVRWITLSMLHAAWAGLVGYCIAYAYLKSQWGFFAGGLAVAAILHGVYNFYSDSMVGVFVGAVSVAAFLFLLRHAQWQFHYAMAQTARGDHIS